VQIFVSMPEAKNRHGSRESCFISQEVDIGAVHKVLGGNDAQPCFGVMLFKY
jgi:hypothetical protein